MGQQDNRRVVFYMPGNFSAMPRGCAEIGIDAFVVMVAPMDKGGFFSCGTNWRLHHPDRTERKEVDRRGQPQDAARVRRFRGAHFRSRRRSSRMKVRSVSVPVGR